MASTVAFTESYRSIRKRFAYHLSKQEGFIMKNFKSKSIIVMIMCSLITIPFLWQCNNSESEQSVTTPLVNSEKIYDMNEVTEKPEILHKEYPVYPEEAREEGISGVVLLSVRADKEGNVDSVKILKSPHKLLSKASIEAVKQWKYKPMLIKGKPMPIIFTVTMTFRLR